MDKEILENTRNTVACEYCGLRYSQNEQNEEMRKYFLDRIFGDLLGKAEKLSELYPSLMVLLEIATFGF